MREQSRFAEAEKVVRQGLVLFEQLALQFPEDRRVPEGLLHCFRHLGLILPNVHRDREAEQALERALAIGEELVSAVPLEPRYRRCQAESLHQLCDLFRVTNRPADAEQACRKAVRIWENLAKQYPTTGEFGAGRAGELHRFAELLSIQKKLPEAEAAYREAIALWEKLVVEDHDYRVELGGTWLRLADFYTLNPRAKEPEKSYQESAAVFEKLYADFPNDPWPAHELGYIYLILAQILEVSKEADRQQEAERVSRRSVTLYEGLVAKHPNVPDYQVRLIWCYRVLAIILRHRGKPQEALELYRDKLTILKKLNTDSIPATELNELSWNLVSCSEPKLRDPIEVELAEKALKKEPLNPPYWNTLGVALYRAGQWQAAVAALKKSNDLLPGSEFSLAGYRDDGGWRPPPPPNVNGFFLAMAYWQLDEKERARQWYAPAILWMEKYNPKNEELRRFRAEAAALLGVPEHSPHPRQEDQHDDVKIYSLILQANPAAAWAYHLRGRIHERRGQAQQAEADYRHAIQLYTRALEANPDQATGWRNRGAAYAERSQWEKAAADYAKATELAPEEAVFWYWDGLARLGAGDLVGYRRACAAMLERFGQTKNPAAAHWVAWGCALASKAASDPEQPVRLAEEALAHEPNNQQYLDTLGAALYRAGRFADAIQRFSRLIAARDQAGTKPLYSPAYTEFFLAMAHHRLGHAAEARHWLDKGVKSMDMETGQKAQIATTGAPIPWNRRLTLQLLRREAEELSKKGISP